MSLEAVVNTALGLSWMALMWWGSYRDGQDHQLFSASWAAWSLVALGVWVVEREWWAVGLVFLSLLVWLRLAQKASRRP